MWNREGGTERIGTEQRNGTNGMELKVEQRGWNGTELWNGTETEWRGETETDRVPSDMAYTDEIQTHPKNLDRIEQTPQNKSRTVLNSMDEKHSAHDNLSFDQTNERTNGKRRDKRSAEALEEYCTSSGAYPYMTWSEDSQSCFIHSTTLMTFGNARDKCADEAAAAGYEGRLAHVLCPEVTAKIQELMELKKSFQKCKKGCPTTRTWIGLQLTDATQRTEVEGWDWYENDMVSSCLRKDVDLNLEIRFNNNHGGTENRGTVKLGTNGAVRLMDTRDYRYYTYICEFRGKFLISYLFYHFVEKTSAYLFFFHSFT